MEKIVFWQDEALQKIDPQLYSKKAEELAKSLINRKLNRRTQIRKFYDEVVRLDMRSRGLNLDNPKDEKKWADTLPLVHMLTAKAAYAEGRKLVTPTFSHFIKNSVAQIEEPLGLKVFATFFEAFMGFYTLHDPKN
jgi:CRISPR-associated protein Csm2